MARKRLGEILIDAGILKRTDLERALLEQRRWGGQLGKILVEQGLVNEDLLMRALAKQLNLPIANLRNVTISQDVLDLVPVELAEEQSLIPFRVNGTFLDVAMSEPMNLGIVDELRIRTRKNVRPHLAPPSQILDAIRKGYKKSDRGDGFDIEFDDFQDEAILRGSRAGRDDPMQDMRDAEIASLQKRVLALEALVARDENVIRKLLGLLIEKQVASRDEILQAIR